MEFDLHATSPAAYLSIRLAYVDFDGGEAAAALDDNAEPDQDFLEAYCTNTVDAMRAMCGWLQAWSAIRCSTCRPDSALPLPERC